MGLLIERYWHKVRAEFQRLPVWLPGTMLRLVMSVR